MGMFLGMLMACSNVYVGLKAGWGLGVTVTSCVLAYTIFASLTRMMPRLFPPFTILENNAMQSCASAAAAMTSAGLVNAIPALMMLSPNSLPAGLHGALHVADPVAGVHLLMGVFLAVPAKRQMVNIEQLPFPTGMAAAATMRALHTKGESAARQARSLGIAGLIGAGDHVDARRRVPVPQGHGVRRAARTGRRSESWVTPAWGWWQQHLSWLG
jgi:uncharacterized oligopeptide transporter (OPT) family protein